MGKEYIDREALMNAIPKPWAKDEKISQWGAVMDCIVIATSIPVADVAPVVHGEWEYYTHTMMACSICKRHVPRHKFEYCPHCGAKMDGGNAEEDSV